MDTEHVRSGAALEGRPAYRHSPWGDKSFRGSTERCRACPPARACAGRRSRLEIATHRLVASTEERRSPSDAPLSCRAGSRKQDHDRGKRDRRVAMKIVMPRVQLVSLAAASGNRVCDRLRGRRDRCGRLRARLGLRGGDSDERMESTVKRYYEAVLDLEDECLLVVVAKRGRAATRRGWQRGMLARPNRPLAFGGR